MILRGHSEQELLNTQPYLTAPRDLPAMTETLNEPSLAEGLKRVILKHYTRFLLLLVGFSLTALHNQLGLPGLAIAWLSLIILGLLVYAIELRQANIELRSELSALSTKKESCGKVLDTIIHLSETKPYDHVSHQFDKGDVIEIDSSSRNSRFGIFMMNSADYNDFVRKGEHPDPNVRLNGRVWTIAGKSDTHGFRETVDIKVSDRYYIFFKLNEIDSLCTTDDGTVDLRIYKE